MKIDQISEDGVRRLVDEFYARVRADTELAPIFNRAIPGDWGLHLATMRDFWSSVMLTSGRYKGKRGTTFDLLFPSVEPDGPVALPPLNADLGHGSVLQR